MGKKEGGGPGRKRLTGGIAREMRVQFPPPHFQESSVFSETPENVLRKLKSKES